MEVATTVGDFDNDGLLDLCLTTVYAPASFGKPNHAVLIRNESGFKFTDVAEQVLLDLVRQAPAWGKLRFIEDINRTVNGLH